ncbi:hypothetical protein P4H66_04155 [Paenibacillus dokdonensis]|uniref:Uncharacterized protein n=1 Tax=Paenibacillus dokdonensis TaxID=2567944 RepID=A0ABU6GH54_9BACL|nr:hypothetical protein [Paenibacillus dokdonensis]MEC0239064.1 hypothetical protein [Paenibacillus dokdonensis]
MKNDLFIEAVWEKAWKEDMQTVVNKIALHQIDAIFKIVKQPS